MAENTQNNRPNAFHQTAIGCLLMGVALLANGCGKVALDFNPGGGLPKSQVAASNRALGNSAFSAISTGESAYGRVSSGPPVSLKGLFGSWAPNSSSNSVAKPNSPAANPITNPNAPWNRKYPVASPNALAGNNPSSQNQNPSPSIQNRSPSGIAQNHLSTASQEVQKLLGDNQQLRSQLKATTDQLADAQAKIQSTGEQLKVMTASARKDGFQGATIRANNSLMANISHLRIAGFNVQPDGDLIRMGISSDLVFQPGTYQVQPGAAQLLNQAASAIARFYPRQIVGIEAHWDNSSTGTSAIAGHQVTTGQALSVLNQLSTQGRLPGKQFLVVGMGGNRPKFANTTPQGQAANRRIELVIYPEQF